MFGNKVLIELKRKLQEIYTNKPWEPIKEGVGVESLPNSIYSKWDEDGKMTFYTSKKINSGEIVSPLYVNHWVNYLGLHIQYDQNPNCQLVGDDLIAVTDIMPDEILTIPGDVYDDIHHGG